MRGMMVRMRVPMMMKEVVLKMMMMVIRMMVVNVAMSMMRMVRLPMMMNLEMMPEEKGVQLIQTGGTAVHGWRGGRDRRFRCPKLF